jgi:hypothetical protein
MKASTHVHCGVCVDATGLLPTHRLFFLNRLSVHWFINDWLIPSMSCVYVESGKRTTWKAKTKGRVSGLASSCISDVLKQNRKRPQSPHLTKKSKYLKLIFFIQQIYIAEWRSYTLKFIMANLFFAVPILIFLHYIYLVKSTSWKVLF